MKFAILVFATLLGSGMACSAGWTSHGDKCYRVIDGVVGTLSDADRYCGQHRSRILTIQSEAEQKFLNNFLFKESNLEDSVWIGGQRQNLKWAWRNDGILIEGNVYSNWASGRPSRTFARACLQINSPSSANAGQWSDNYCFAMNSIVCERFRTNNEEPSDEENESGNGSGNASCNCGRFEEEVSRVREEFERRMSQLQEQMNRRESELWQSVNDRLNQFHQRLSKVEAHGSGASVSEEWVRGVVHLDEIQHNFTSIAGVLGFHNHELNNLREEMERNNNNHNHGSTDTSAIRSELERYVDRKLQDLNLDEVVNDAKLSYVNYRRALSVKKRGRWVQLGYV